MMPVLVGVSGLGTEGGLLFYQHRSLQSAADAAGYSAAISYSYSSSADITTQAKAVVVSYGYALGTGTNQANVAVSATTVPTTSGGTLNAVHVTISRPQSAIFSSIYLPVLQNSVSATAVLTGGSSGSNPSGGCILALGNNPSTGTNNLANAISLQGNPNITVSGCGIFSDSTDCVSGSYSESIGGSATITAGSLGPAGCTNIFGHAQVSLPGAVTCTSSGSAACTQDDGTLTDPYAGTTLPSSPSGCTLTNYSPTLSSTTITLSPGRYCGATSLKSTGSSPSTFILSTGVYIFDSQGSTSTTLDLEKVTLTDEGAGATLVFTCSTCTIPLQWPSPMMATDSLSTICASAPTTGTTAGFVIIGAPAMPLGTTFSTWANGQNYFNGTVWMPSGAFSWGGNASTAPSACNYPTSGLPTFCLQLIANQVSLGGSSDYFGGAGCSLSGGSGGSGGSGEQIQKPIGSTVTLVD
jgi:hypothetical protein